MFDNKVWIFNNIVNRTYQEKIKDELLGNKRLFPWYFIPDITHIDGPQSRPGFQHVLVDKEKVNSNFYDLIIPIINNSLKKIKYNLKVIKQGRAFVQLPLNMKTKKVDTPHIDLNERHLVVLYYVSNSDGDTIIYKDKKFKKKLHKITPKQGRVVVFDGGLWHTAEQPKKNVRCVINCDVI